jgi:histidyl-tRNA synthetase
MTPEAAQRCLALARIRTADTSFVAQVRALGVEHPLLDEGLDELAAVGGAAEARMPGAVVADLRIARGLDYYTGTVYETQLVGHEDVGSICSGGRYDALASDGRTTYPGVGISLGVSRLMGVLLGRGLVRATRSVPTCVLVAVADEDSRGRSADLAAELRVRGIPTEVAPRADRFGKQIKYADRRGIPFVWFPEDAEGSPYGSVKDIRSGLQVAADPATWWPPEEDLHPRVVRVSATLEEEST